MENIKNYIALEERTTVMLVVFIFISSVMLAAVHGIMVKKNHGPHVWRILCVLPLILCVLHFSVHRFTGNARLTFTLYAAMYAAAAFIFIGQFFYKTGKLYKASAVFNIIMSFAALAATLIIPLSVSPAVHNFTRMGYSDSMRAVIETMKQEYVLSDWKKTDYDMIESKVMPMAEQAEEENNPALFYAALVTYSYYFYDRHVITESEYEAGAKEILAGNDYGMSMITLDNGDTAAILVEYGGEAYKKGIRNGYVIKKWNGEDTGKALETVECIYPGLAFPVRENEDYFRAMFLAGKGGDRVETVYEDEEGETHCVVLEKNGSYAERLDRAISLFTWQNDRNYSNYTCEMLDSECGYIRITEEFYDYVRDAFSMVTGKHPSLEKALDEKLSALREQGMKKLIIDLRNNVGGVDDISSTIVSMFTEDTFYAHGIGIFDGIKYCVNEPHYVFGNGKYSDIEVAVLVNYACCSAGDNMAYNFSKLDNAIIAGITVSCGVDQNMGGLCVMTDSDFTVKYPAGLVLAEEGYPLIDTDSDRKSNIELDYRIRLDYEGAMRIFSGTNGDYELECTLEYLKRK